MDKVKCAAYVIKELERNKSIYRTILENIEEGTERWRPGAGKWCLLEIICHLVDEEKEDFRKRVKWTIEKPEQLPPNIDPGGWVLSRGYLQQNYDDKVKEWLSERQHSIDWLQSLDLDAIKWTNGYDHPILGRITAYQFLCNWLAHDYHHIRQINRLRHQMLRHISGEKLSYAGNHRVFFQDD